MTSSENLKLHCEIDEPAAGDQRSEPGQHLPDRLSNALSIQHFEDAHNDKNKSDLRDLNTQVESQQANQEVVGGYLEGLQAGSKTQAME